MHRSIKRQKSETNFCGVAWFATAPLARRNETQSRLKKTEKRRKRKKEKTEFFFAFVFLCFSILFLEQGLFFFFSFVLSKYYERWIYAITQSLLEEKVFSQQELNEKLGVNTEQQEPTFQIGELVSFFFF